MEGHQVDLVQPEAERGGTAVDSHDFGSVAIVHDYLNQRGGAERVALQLARIWPDAPFFTALYRADSVFPEFREVHPRTTFVDRAPVDAGFRILAPLLPLAFRSLGVLNQDVVISSSSGWAHSVRTAPRSTHVVYCYAPARWLYSADRYFERPAKRLAALPLTSALRGWDRRAARRADAYISIASNVRDRVRSAYGIESEVVYPPVDTTRVPPSPRGERLLAISRLLPYKRLDLLIAAATQLGLGLDVVGDGPLRADLRELAGPSVTFHGTVPDTTLTELLSTCSAICMPGHEDFGIVAVEGNAAGKPALAFAAGGALETIKDGVNGVLFDEPTVDSVIAGIRRLGQISTSFEEIAASAQRFSIARFCNSFSAAVRRAIDAKQARALDAAAHSANGNQPLSPESALRR
jgi:glycosyltransferase involved in cell wall biosynthesis